MKDYYKILEISPNVTAQQIRKAYRLLCLMYHPDRYSHSNNEELTKKAEEKFKLIQQAYEVLSDSQKRTRYDASRSQTQRTTEYAKEERVREEVYQVKRKRTEPPRRETPTRSFPFKSLTLSLSSLLLGLIGLLLLNSGPESFYGWAALLIAVGIIGMAIGGWLLCSHGTTSSKIAGALLLAPGLIIIGFVALTVIIVVLVVVGFLFLISKAI